jgi:hypothetical protein
MMGSSTEPGSNVLTTRFHQIAAIYCRPRFATDNESRMSSLGTDRRTHETSQSSWAPQIAAKIINAYGFHFSDFFSSRGRSNSGGSPAPKSPRAKYVKCSQRSAILTLRTQKGCKVARLRGWVQTKSLLKSTFPRGAAAYGEVKDAALLDGLDEKNGPSYHCEDYVTFERFRAH